ncbi:SDR family NAD(P)-dependent oxidoreductase [Rathayibacter toxicus]|nr:SDR family oxidoreductase [Rathayibacter toxicus]PPH24818.1 hypothetical protein C5D17_02245 [Rathayibacter toxicus]PPH60738.1 hypothetical protein C5C93_02295 [Rathayibacter toxicus]PPH88558.1 hypothetical protein C5D31_02270 [Rathayibacter toxicus]PPI32871.1 hypothetical protein C5D65_02255 [Rathayibacter toxicus]PPI66892.1 hypothetical protein C5D47_02295 [Rathayibacter toxicus]
MTTDRPVALVTGSSSGLGNGMCRALLEQGWTVLAHVRRSKQSCRLADLGAHLVEADLSSRDEVSDLVAQIISSTDRLDALVNNAALGYGPPGAVRHMTCDRFESRLAVNVLAPLALLKGLGGLLGEGGRVVNLASTNQELIDADDLQLAISWSRERSYRQSKALGLIVTEVFARRWAPQNVTVNAIHPGTRLPTKIVLESSVEPLGNLELGIETCVNQATAVSNGTGMFVRAGEETLRVDQLYPDRAANDAIVARLEGLLV